MSGVDITAADREAAARRWNMPVDALDDSDADVQAFAQHRIQARNEALEDAAKVADDNRTDDDSMWDRAAETVATAIRTLTQPTKGE